MFAKRLLYQVPSSFCAVKDKKLQVTDEISIVFQRYASESE